MKILSLICLLICFGVSAEEFKSIDVKGDWTAEDKSFYFNVTSTRDVETNMQNYFFTPSVFVQYNQKVRRTNNPNKYYVIGFAKLYSCRWRVETRLEYLPDLDLVIAESFMDVGQELFSGICIKAGTHKTYRELYRSEV
jgi:hypothetical protein